MKGCNCLQKEPFTNGDLRLVGKPMDRMSGIQLSRNTHKSSLSRDRSTVKKASLPAGV